MILIEGGEDGIAGFCDGDQTLCLAPAFWNGKDSILKERLFGLTNGEGNHGEDVKELYFHLDSSPTHSYCKFLYKYPQECFPYLDLVKENRKDRLTPEYELLETGYPMRTGISIVRSNMQKATSMIS
jgi:hypothetical protein